MNYQYKITFVFLLIFIYQAQANFTFANIYQKGKLIDILLNEQYKKFTQQINVSNPSNKWVKQPLPFSDSGQISVQCIKNRDWNPEFLMFQKDETLIKLINTHSYTNKINHFKMILNAKILLIDIFQQEFTLQVKSGDYITNISNLIGTGTQYCNEYLSSQTECNDYCASSAFDSYVSLALDLNEHTEQLILEFSSKNLKDNQFIGIHSLSIQVDLCDDNCLTCSGASDNCLSCKESQPYLDIQTNKCVQNCGIGQFEDIGQFNSLQKICKPCAYDNCEECDNSQCKKCKQGYHFNQQQKQCVLCQQFCSVCQDISTCSQCVQGYHLNSQGICQNCKQNCLDCKSENVCNLCSQGYYLINGSCQQCSPFCQDCDQDSVCKQCQPNYLIKKRVLSIEKDECVQVCGQFFFPSNDNTSCIHQNDSMCLDTIDEVNGCQGKKCKRDGSIIYANNNKECILDCPKGYFKSKISDDQYSCVQCPLYCLDCISQNECTECAYQHYLKQENLSNKICQKCSDQCESCTGENQCSSCKDGYFLDGDNCVKTCSGSKYGKDKKCFDCNLLNCSKCFNQSDCEICQTGYVEIEGQCLKKCLNGEYREGNNTYCSKCSENCEDCTSGSKCNSCKRGFYLANNICKNCDKSCQSCLGPLDNQCEYCDESKNLFLFQGSCISECPEGFYQSGNKQCLPCSSKGCSKCFKANQCSLCKSSSDFLKNEQECTQLCPTDHQIFTDEKNILNCFKIDCGYGMHQNQKVCEEICGDGIVQNQECDDGNLQRGDGCNEKCQIEPHFVCSSPQNNFPSVCKFILKYDILDIGIENAFVLQFNTSVEILNENVFELSIESLKKGDFSYKIDGQLAQPDQKVVHIDFKVQVPKQVNVIVTNQQLSDSYIKLTEYSEYVEFSLKNQQKMIVIQSQYIYSKDEIQVSKFIKNLARVFCCLIMLSFIPLTFLGQANLVVNLVDILQIIYFHYFIDIKYPLLLSEFFKVFAIFDFTIFKNIFTGQIPNDLERYSFESFERNNKQTTFIENTGQYFTLWLSIIFLNGIFKFAAIQFSSVKEYSNKIFKYQIYYQLIAIAYSHILFYAFYQMTNMQTEHQIEYLNQVFMFLAFIIVFPAPFLGLFYMRKHRSMLKEENIQKNYGCVWYGFKEEFSSQIYFILIGFKKLLYSIIFIFMNSITIAQCAFLILLPLCLIVYLIWKKPFAKKLDNEKQIFQEILLVLAAIFLIVLKFNNSSKESVKIIYSSIVILSFFIILISNSIFVINEIHNQLIKKAIKFLQEIIKITQTNFQNQLFNKNRIQKIKETFKRFSDKYQQKEQSSQLTQLTQKKSIKRKKSNKKISAKQFLTCRTDEVTEQLTIEDNSLKNMPKSYNFEENSDVQQIKDQNVLNEKNLSIFHKDIQSEQNSFNLMLQNESKVYNYNKNQHSPMQESPELFTFQGADQKDPKMLKQKSIPKQQIIDETIEMALEHNQQYNQLNVKRQILKIPKLFLFNQQSTFQELNQKNLEIESPIVNQYKIESQSQSQLELGSYTSTSIGSPDKLIRQSSSQILLNQESINQSHFENYSHYDNLDQSQAEQNFMNSLNKFRNKRKHNSLIRRSLRPSYESSNIKSNSTANLEKSEAQFISSNNLEQSSYE